VEPSSGLTRYKDDRRRFLRLNVVFTFCVIIFMVMSLIAVVVVPLILSRFGFDRLSLFPVADAH
jgi:hypothetical protein